MNGEEFLIRTDGSEITLLVVHHPESKKNEDLQHGSGNQRLSPGGIWEAMNLGLYLAQRILAEGTPGSSSTQTPESPYALDLAAGLQERCQEGMVRAKRATVETLRAMGSQALIHVPILVGWRGIGLGRLDGLTDEEIAHESPAFARSWMNWRLGRQPLPPDVSEYGGEPALHFATRVMSSLRYVIEHRRSNLIVAVLPRSVLQLTHSLLQDNDPRANVAYIDPPYGWVEEWRLSDGPPQNITGRFVSPVELAATLWRRSAGLDDQEL